MGLGAERTRVQSAFKRLLHNVMTGEVRVHDLELGQKEREEKMSVVEDRYRGTTKYVHVLGELVRAAQYRGVTTYQDIAVIMRLPLTGNYMQAETGHVLGEISEDEVAAGRPMLSAVAVNVNGKPGPGFYGLQETLGGWQKGRMSRRSGGPSATRCMTLGGALYLNRSVRRLSAIAHAHGNRRGETNP